MRCAYCHVVGHVVGNSFDDLWRSGRRGVAESNQPCRFNGGIHVWVEDFAGAPTGRATDQTCALGAVDMEEFRKLESLVVAAAPFVRRYRELRAKLVGVYPDKSQF